LHGKGSIQGILRIVQSYLRPLLAKIYRFDFLEAWQGPIMISGCSSDLLYLLILGKALPPFVSYDVMGHAYTKGNYLADDIYLEWPVFVNTHLEPKAEKYSRFTKEQEACQKDVEQAFGVL
jgi:hypothetical protein